MTVNPVARLRESIAFPLQALLDEALVFNIPHRITFPEIHAAQRRNLCSVPSACPDPALAGRRVPPWPLCISSRNSARLTQNSLLPKLRDSAPSACPDPALAGRRVPLRLLCSSALVRRACALPDPTARSRGPRRVTLESGIFIFGFPIAISCALGSEFCVLSSSLPPVPCSLSPPILGCGFAALCSSALFWLQLPSQGLSASECGCVPVPLSLFTFTFLLFTWQKICYFVAPV